MRDIESLKSQGICIDCLQPHGDLTYRCAKCQKKHKEYYHTLWLKETLDKVVEKLSSIKDKLWV